MRKRGRQSAADLSVHVDGRVSRLTPPADLSDKESALFRELVHACPPEHFALSDRPLLAAYCTAICLSRWAAGELADDPRQIATWEKATRTLATLATKLRLAPQSRTDPKTAGRKMTAWTPSAYENMT